MMYRALASLFLVSLLACSRKVDEPDPVKKDPTPAATATMAAPSAAPSGSSANAVGANDLLKVDLKVGDGEEAKVGDMVKVHYTGTLTNGTKFDSSHDRNEPFSFRIGGGEVIKGWDQGVPGMKVGGKRKLTIGYALAYGETGHPPTIPGKATLVFEIELLEIVKK